MRGRKDKSMRIRRLPINKRAPATRTEEITGLLLKIDKTRGRVARADLKYLVALYLIVEGNLEGAKEIYQELRDEFPEYSPGKRGFREDYWTRNPGEQPIATERNLFVASHPRFDYNNALRILEGTKEVK